MIKRQYRCILIVFFIFHFFFCLPYSVCFQWLLILHCLYWPVLSINSIAIKFLNDLINIVFQPCSTYVHSSQYTLPFKSPFTFFLPHLPLPTLARKTMRKSSKLDCISSSRTTWYEDMFSSPLGGLQMELQAMGRRPKGGPSVNSKALMCWMVGVVSPKVKVDSCNWAKFSKRAE